MMIILTSLSFLIKSLHLLITFDFIFPATLEVYVFPLLGFDRGSKALVLRNAGGHTSERYDALRRGCGRLKTLKFALRIF